MAVLEFTEQHARTQLGETWNEYRFEVAETELGKSTLVAKCVHCAVVNRMIGVAILSPQIDREEQPEHIGKQAQLRDMGKTYRIIRWL